MPEYPYVQSKPPQPFPVRDMTAAAVVCCRLFRVEGNNRSVVCAVDVSADLIGLQSFNERLDRRVVLVSFLDRDNIYIGLRRLGIASHDLMDIRDAHQRVLEPGTLRNLIDLAADTIEELDERIEIMRADLRSEE